MKRLFLFLLGILTALILPYVVEYFMPYRPGFADRMESPSWSEAHEYE